MVLETASGTKPCSKLVSVHLTYVLGVLTRARPGGWLPRHCLNERGVQPYQIPFQKELQGRWEADTTIVVKGLLVHTTASSLPFVLREEDGKVRLLGFSLESCDGKVARWSNGQEWNKQEGDEVRGGEWHPEDEDLPDLAALEPREDVKKDA